ncbi:MAG: four helix bundle protein [Bacteroidetes bacterium]|nr:four helix bundle protein [Bacteroidota bacterium]
MMEKKFDLEERLIEFAAQIIHFTESMISSKSGNHLANQLLRSGTSPALNYGEAQGGESRKDFIHKFKVILKELRETLIGIKIVERASLHQDHGLLNQVKDECNQLISIFVKSVLTAERNRFE